MKPAYFEHAWRMNDGSLYVGVSCTEDIQKKLAYNEPSRVFF